MAEIRDTLRTARAFIKYLPPSPETVDLLAELDAAIKLLDRERRNTLTVKQRLLLDFIEDYIRKNHRSPTFRELASTKIYGGLFRSHDAVTTLIGRGFLGHRPGCHRSLSMVG